MKILVNKDSLNESLIEEAEEITIINNGVEYVISSLANGLEIRKSGEKLSIQPNCSNVVNII